MSPGTTAAVVVTFNRKALLCECLDALLSQSLPLDAIFIVDNASTDGTSELLRERGYLERASVHYLALPENLGGAGGFHAGMAAAHRERYDWIWVMDDDCEPRLDAVEKMEIWKTYPKVVAIANRKVTSDGDDTADGLRLFSSHAVESKPYTQVQYSSFVGLLVNRSAIDAIGLPRSEFFIHKDDTEYCIRLRSIGDIALAVESVVIHKEMARQQKSKTLFRHVFYHKDIQSFCFDYYGHRNHAWIQRAYSKSGLACYLGLAARFACFAAVVVAFDNDYKWKRLTILARANLDGIKGHFDNEFPRRLRDQLSKNLAKG